MFNQVLCAPKPLCNNLFALVRPKKQLAPSSHPLLFPPHTSLLLALLQVRLLLPSNPTSSSAHTPPPGCFVQAGCSRPERKYQRLPSRCRREPRFRSFLRADGDLRDTGRECPTPGAGPTFMRWRWWRRTTLQGNRRRPAQGTVERRDFVIWVLATSS